MLLLNDIKSSIYSPRYYQSLLSQKFSYSLKYFFSLVLLLTFITALIASFSIVPGINSFLKNAGPKILEYYPQELEIVIKGGKASTNVPEPYFIKLPQELAGNQFAESSLPNIKNLLVIDTKSAFTVEGFKSLKTLTLLTQDSFVYGEDSKITIQPLTTMPNLTLNKSVISNFLSKAEPYFKFIPPIVVVVIFFVFFLISTAKLTYLLLLAVFIWLIAKFRKINIGYIKSYQLGLHLATFGLILDHLLMTLPTIKIPYLFTTITLIMAIINLKGIPKESVTPQTQ